METSTSKGAGVPRVTMGVLRVAMDDPEVAMARLSIVS